MFWVLVAVIMALAHLLMGLGYIARGETLNAYGCGVITAILLVVAWIMLQ